MEIRGQTMTLGEGSDHDPRRGVLVLGGSGSDGVAAAPRRTHHLELRPEARRHWFTRRLCAGAKDTAKVNTEGCWELSQRDTGSDL